MGFSEMFCKDEYLVEEFRLLFPDYTFTHQDVPRIKEYFSKNGNLKSIMDDWTEAWRLYNEGVDKMQKEKAKRNRARSIRKDVALTVISRGMADKQLKYAIECHEYRMIVYVDILGKWQVHFSITYSSYDPTTSCLFENIDRIIAIQQSNAPIFKLQKIDRSLNWIKCNLPC